MQSTSGSPSKSLEHLMQSFQEGDEGAFAELYSRVAPGLQTKLMRTSRDPEQARDVVQTTFLKVFRSKDRYETGAPVLPWIHVIAKRTLIDEQRPLGARYEVLSHDGQLPDDGVHPSQAAVPVDETLLLRRALAELPDQYRDAIELTKLAGMTGTEAALQLHTTAAAIKQRVHRGYELIRNWLDTGSLPGGTAAA